MPFDEGRDAFEPSRRQFLVLVGVEEISLAIAAKSRHSRRSRATSRKEAGVTPVAATKTGSLNCSRRPLRGTALGSEE